MTTTELITLLGGRDVRLHLKENGRLGVDAPKGVLTPTLLGELREHKQTLLRILSVNPGILNFETAGKHPHNPQNSSCGASEGSFEDFEDENQQNQNAKQEPQADRLGETADRLRSRSGLPTRPATSPDPGNVPPAARPARRPAPCRGVSIPWPGAAADFVLLLGPEDLPRVPFRLGPGMTIHDTAKFLAWLRRDIALGTDSPRAVWGCLQSDLLRLRELLLGPGGARGPYPRTRDQQAALTWLMSVHPGKKAGPSDGPECERVLSRLQAKYPETVGQDDDFTTYLRERWDDETQDCGG